MLQVIKASLWLLYIAVSVLAIPTWEGMVSRDQIGSIVPGAGYVEGLGPIQQGDYTTKHLSATGPRGVPSNLTVYNNPAPSPFFVGRDRQLYQITNETTILRVNAINSTAFSGHPLRLTLGNKIEGLKGGTWRWKGTMLFYDYGSATNSGVYYSCRDQSSAAGIYMYLKPSPTPDGCILMTLHSFTKRARDS